MQINPLSIYQVFFVLSALLILVWDIFRNERVLQEAKFAVAIALCAFLIYVQGASQLLFVPGVVIFYFMGRFYGSIDDVPIALLAFGYVIVASMYSNISIVAEVALLGLLASISIGKNITGNDERSNAVIETRRDVLQFFLGVLLLLVFYFVSLQRAELFTMLLLILGYITIDLALVHKDRAVYRFIHGMERRGALLGEGAVMLGIGTLAVIAVLGSAIQVMIALSALFLGDSIATMIGINLKGPKLPYNKDKSVSGSIACFIVVSLVAYQLAGGLGILFGAIAAIAEGMETPVDDNLFVAIIMVFLVLIA